MCLGILRLSCSVFHAQSWTVPLEQLQCILWGSSVLSSAVPAEDILFEALAPESADPHQFEGCVVPSMFVLHAKRKRLDSILAAWLRSSLAACQISQAPSALLLKLFKGELICMSFY